MSPMIGAFFTLLLKIAPELWDLLNKTPAEKWGELGGRILDFLGEVRDAGKKGKETGDYSDLEDVIRRRSR